MNATQCWSKNYCILGMIQVDLSNLYLKQPCFIHVVGAGNFVLTGYVLDIRKYICMSSRSWQLPWSVKLNIHKVIGLEISIQNNGVVFIKIVFQRFNEGFVRNRNIFLFHHRCSFSCFSLFSLFSASFGIIPIWSYFSFLFVFVRQYPRFCLLSCLPRNFLGPVFGYGLTKSGVTMTVSLEQTNRSVAEEQKQIFIRENMNWMTICQVFQIPFEYSVFFNISGIAIAANFGIS